jgi:hypothetical protein
MNDGDWVESCTALVEHHDGGWEIVTWTRENEHENSKNIQKNVSSDTKMRQRKRKENVVQSTKEVTETQTH